MKLVTNAMMMAVLAMSFTAVNVFASDTKVSKSNNEAVVKRVDRVEQKTNEAVASGKLTEAQGQALNDKAEKIKSEESNQAAANGGEITRQEKKEMKKEAKKVARERRELVKKNKMNKGSVLPSATPVASPVASPGVQK